MSVVLRRFLCLGVLGKPPYNQWLCSASLAESEVNSNGKGHWVIYCLSVQQLFQSGGLQPLNNGQN